jgi:hypothetical protein
MHVHMSRSIDEPPRERAARADMRRLTERFVYGADDIDIVAADRTVWLVV